LGLLMKTLLKIFFAFVVFAGLFGSAIGIGVRIFLADVVSSHGMALLGAPFSVSNPEIDYRAKSIIWPDWKIVNAVGSNAVSPIVSVSSVTIQLPLDFALDWRFAGLVPSPMHIKTVTIDGIILSYDIDAEAESLNVLKRRISAAAETAMRDRLNAVTKDQNANQSFIIDELILSGIAIDAYSILSPEKKQRISVKQIGLGGLGVEEQGLYASEIVDRVTKQLIDRVKQEAISHGLVEVKPVIAPTKKTTRRKSDVVTDENNDSQIENEEGGAKKAVKAVGRGFKKVGQSIGNGFKKLFN
jgi:hypothetical protein